MKCLEGVNVMNPEDVIANNGVTQQTFVQLYADSETKDPWYVNESQAERLRIRKLEGIMLQIFPKYAKVLDYGSGTTKIGDGLPFKFVRYDFALTPEFDVFFPPEIKYDAVLISNVMCYYTPEERQELRTKIMKLVRKGGWVFECEPIRGVMSIPFNEFVDDMKQVVEIYKVDLMSFDWYDDRKFRDSPMYAVKFAKELGEPIQVMITGRKL